ncbi:MAG UNVERIFIED_CONTAM: MCP four helix bundle domain-containing protein, partial [Methylobacterium ajmalii]
MKLKISHILIGLIAILSAGLLAQGVVGGSQLRAVNANSLDLSENWLPSVRELGELKYKVTRLRLVDARYVMASEAVNELDAVSESRAKNIDEVASRYETLISNAEERGLWTTFRRHWDEYLAMRSKIVAAARARDQRASSELFQASRQPFDAALAALDRSTALNVKGGEAAQLAAQAIYSRALWLTGLLCCLGLAIALAGAAYVVGGITRPIDRLIRRMRGLTAGDVDGDVPHTDRTDEIGAIAGAVESSRDNLVRTRQLEQETLLARNSAEEQRKAGMRQMADGFERAVGGIVGLVSSSATELQATAGTMTATATQTASQSTAVAAAAEE